MHYLALATDYDGTLAHNGQVDAPTLAALQRLRDSGRRLLLVTGRRLDDLQTAFSPLTIFDVIVAENGALLYWPQSGEQWPLGPAPPPALLERLRADGVPYSTGRVIVATWEQHLNAVIDAIRILGLDWRVILNKGAVMVLPSQIDKATGLTAAFHELKVSPLNTVAVGDAENDHAFLAACGVAVAVANALPSLKVRAHMVTHADHGAGVTEVIDRLIADDLASLNL